jgi:hypothetical protein
MQSDAFYNEELIDTTIFATNDKMFDMAVERVGLHKDVEEFESIYRANNCQLTGDKEFADMYNMMSVQYDEMECEHEFNRAFDEDVTEQDSGYQEVTCPTLESGCSMDEFEKFAQMWRRYAGHNDETDTRELRQALLNCTVGHLEREMYKTLGAEVDHLPEADLLDELRLLAMVKPNTEVQVEAHHAMENSVVSTLTKGNVTYKIINPFIAQNNQNQPALTKRGTANNTTRSDNEMLDTEAFRDKSTPDWSENVSSLKLIKMNIPNRLNITKLNQSCNTATMTMGRWERPNNMPMDTPKDHKLLMSTHEDPDEDNITKETMDTMKLS